MPSALESGSDSGPSRPRGVSFVAPDIAAAIVQIREKLGGDAVILDIRRQPANGLRRLWQKPQVEVLACLPETSGSGVAPGGGATVPDRTGTEPSVPSTAAKSSQANVGTGFAQEPFSKVPQREAMNRYARAGVASGLGDDGDSLPGSGTVETVAGSDALVPDTFEPSWERRGGTGLTSSRTAIGRESSPGSTERAAGGAAAAEVEPSPWRCRGVFDRLGLVPVVAEKVLSVMQELHGPRRRPPETLMQELVLARAALNRLWKPTPSVAPGGPAPLHVFLGAPGSGKSTALCKWLAQTVLVDSKPARVWRLDGRTVNCSEQVSLYGEILGVEVERTWNGRPDPSVTGFVDLGGADFRDRESVEALAGTLGRLPGATIHLVLNAAYTVPLLMAQARAFSVLPIDDLIVTHLDEEPAWGKLWNLVVGTNFPLHRLGIGQNIPGRFQVATPEHLCGSLFGG